MKSEKKVDDDLKVGIEIEHFLVDETTMESQHYYSEKGIAFLLNELVEKKEWKVFHQEGPHILGIEKSMGTITVEPGGQLELSLVPQQSIDGIEDLYVQFRQDVESIISPLGMKLVSFGYHPKSDIKDIPFNPKKRYSFMSEYLGSKGEMAHHMMKGSAAVQMAIDYTSESDFAKKFTIASYLSPILSFLFDNSPIFNGEYWDKASLRAHIWENCDRERCGVVTESLESNFSYEKYADYILRTPMIFVPRDGDYEYTGDKTIDAIENFEPTATNVEHALSMVFPDVRAKSYIEIRMIDAVPIEYALGFVALMKGILYNHANIFLLSHLFAQANIDEFNSFRLALMDGNAKAKFLNRDVFEWSDYLLSLVDFAQIGDDARRLEPLKELWSNRKTLKMIYSEEAISVE